MYSFVGTKSRYGQIERGNLYPVKLPLCPNCKDFYFHKCHRCGWIDNERWYLSFFHKKHHFHVMSFTGPREQVIEEAKVFLLAKLNKIPKIWSLLPGERISIRS